MSVASEAREAHLEEMLKRKPSPPELEAPRADRNPAVFEARPMPGKPDWLKMARDIRRRFPKVMARLAE